MNDAYEVHLHRPMRAEGLHNTQLNLAIYESAELPVSWVRHSHADQSMNLRIYYIMMWPRAQRLKDETVNTA